MKIDMPEISSRDFGRLESDVRNLTDIVKSIDNKVTGVMTRSEFAEFSDRIVRIQELHDSRLEALEQREAARTSSIWSRIGSAADQNFVSFMGKVIFLIFGGLIATYFLTNYQVAPRDESATAIHRFQGGEQ